MMILLLGEESPFRRLHKLAVVRRRHLLLELRQDVLHRVLPLPLGQHLELVPFNLCMHDPVISWLRGPMMVPVHERMKMSSPSSMP